MKNFWIIQFLMGVFLLTSCQTLPPLSKIKNQIRLEQNWNLEQRQWFHSVSQGTVTFLSYPSRIGS